MWNNLKIIIRFFFVKLLILKRDIPWFRSRLIFIFFELFQFFCAISLHYEWLDRVPRSVMWLVWGLENRASSILLRGENLPLCLPLYASILSQVLASYGTGTGRFFLQMKGDRERKKEAEPHTSIHCRSLESFELYPSPFHISTWFLPAVP